MQATYQPAAELRDYRIAEIKHLEFAEICLAPTFNIPTDNNRTYDRNAMEQGPQTIIT